MPGEHEPLFDTRGHVRNERQAALAHIGELAIAYFSPFHQRERGARKTLEAAIADYNLGYGAGRQNR